jgi:uncharacterized protein YeaO (DUF488 family)
MKDTFNVFRGLICMIILKRIYDEPSKDDGQRILVERLWPRGFTKERAAVDMWLKEVAPSPELRKWFGHEPEKWEEISERYLKELDLKKDMLKLLKQKSKEGTITFVYAAKDEKYNAAVALKALLESR